jgi:hypothetical protein
MAITQVLAILLAAALGSSENSGVVFVQRQTTGAGQSSVMITTIDQGKLRHETYTGTSRLVQLFDSATRSLKTLDLVKKTYRITQTAPDRIGYASRYEYRKLGAGRVGEWPCTIYQVFRPGVLGASVRESETCIAETSRFNLTPSDLSITQELQGLGSFLYILPPSFPLTVTREFSGIPVRVIRFNDDGSIASTSELQEFRRESIAPSSFDMPAGFSVDDSGPLKIAAPTN